MLIYVSPWPQLWSMVWQPFHRLSTAQPLLLSTVRSKASLTPQRPRAPSPSIRGSNWVPMIPRLPSEHFRRQRTPPVRPSRPLCPRPITASSSSPFSSPICPPVPSAVGYEYVRVQVRTLLEVVPVPFPEGGGGRLAGSANPPPKKMEGHPPPLPLAEQCSDPGRRGPRRPPLRRRGLPHRPPDPPRGLNFISFFQFHSQFVCLFCRTPHWHHDPPGLFENISISLLVHSQSRTFCFRCEGLLHRCSWG